MAEQYRVLVSCPLAWDGVEEMRDLLDEHGIGVDFPEVPGQALSEPDLLGVIGQYDGMLAGDDELSRAVIEAGSRLKVIAKWGVGVDAIDLQAAADRGVAVLNTPGVFGDELADYAMGYLILIARQQHVVDREVRAGHWHKPRGHSLADRTLGIVGLGFAGSALGTRARAMRMNVIGTDPLLEHDRVPRGVEPVGLEELLSRSDAVSLHLPLIPETESLISKSAVAAMRPGVWLVNTSRGRLIDEEALLAGLDSGQIGAAALDVFREEPLPSDHPLLTYPQVILGSHNGSNTHEAVERTTRRAVENLIAGLEGGAG